VNTKEAEQPSLQVKMEAVKAGMVKGESGSCESWKGER
jgi:hypothetical protein